MSRGEIQDRSNVRSCSRARVPPTPLQHGFTSLAILGIRWSGRVCPSGSKPCETFGFGRTLQANLWHARNAFAALTPAEGTGHSHFTILPFSIAIFLPGFYTCLLIPIGFFRSFFVLMKKIRFFFHILTIHSKKQHCLLLTKDLLSCSAVQEASCGLMLLPHTPLHPLFSQIKTSDLFRFFPFL